MIRSIQDLDLTGKRVLMRVDFNVPMDGDEIKDVTRIKNALPSIEYAIKQGAKLILMSHLGRPKAKELSLKSCAKKLQEMIDREVKLAPDCIGDQVKTLAMSMENGDVLMLENLRWHVGEEHPEKDPDFAKQLASLGEIYVDDAFGAAHRKHTSTYVLPRFFPERCASGFLMENEITHLTPLTLNPKRPFYAVLGGAKISTKIGVLAALLEKVDGLFIGGAMAFTFLKAQGISIGNSLCDDAYLDQARSIMKTCEEKAIKFWLPTDILMGRNFIDEPEIKAFPVKAGLPDGWQGMDIGPSTIEDWSPSLKSAATIFWNGPMGIFEVDEFAEGTKKLAELLSQMDAMTVVGGGDSVSAVNQLRLSKYFTHLSTGGGAALEFIEHGHLPGIDALDH
ncbi:MAG: phosphoglycerate kinase [Chlamydiia bacterium]|nr:phosphoglycerate kinase [Chlamydiia bacterium]MCP5492384.1 phosphoglycerate kinase [Chlamydiales bacterium]